MKPSLTADSLNTFLKNYSIVAKYDIIKKNIVIDVPDSVGVPGSERYENIEHSIFHIKNLMIINDLPIGGLRNTLDLLCYSNPVNPVVDHLSTLPKVTPGWIRMLGQSLVVLPDREGYRDKIFRMFMISACAAADHAEKSPIKDKDARFENVFTLSGNEGIGKTGFFRKISPVGLKEYFKHGQTFSVRSERRKINSLSSWICEFVDTYKYGDTPYRSLEFREFLRTSTDSVYSPRYNRARGILEFKRRTVFVRTTDNRFGKRPINDPHWLLPVESISVTADQTIIDNAWSEAWSAYIGGEPWWTDIKADYTNILQEGIDLESILLKLIDNREGCFSKELFTSSDIVNTLGNEGGWNSKILNPRTIGKAMMRINLFSKGRTRVRRFYTWKELDGKYSEMTGTQIDEAYDAQNN